MKLIDIINSRYSYRGYLDRNVEQEKIDYILECARLAPSAKNLQPWKIYIVKSKEMKERVCQAYARDWLKEAPIIAVFVGKKGSNWVRRDGEDYLMCDVTIITDYFVLAATEMGLGTCYIAAFDREKLKEALNLPENEEPFLMTPLGYPKKEARRERSRKPLPEIVEEV
ncbi:nitroreductase [Thermotomaculum hydrothermale]|uniref:Nitroreductase n=1 Tax=Thermotomaculum hydrothermale TaxID=981385 RepID=A0A7R6PG42_9BACT|nr:nitroreductase family protein [Thermotomaculum hydrothermale]BBB33109.1 nitroreductase [Thermotomaculum hydrothermale]